LQLLTSSVLFSSCLPLSFLGLPSFVDLHILTAQGPISSLFSLPAPLVFWLPSFVDLPILTAQVYLVELQWRLQLFLARVPPAHPTTAVKRLLHAAADLEQSLIVWGIG